MEEKDLTETSEIVRDKSKSPSEINISTEKSPETEKQPEVDQIEIDEANNTNTNLNVDNKVEQSPEVIGEVENVKDVDENLEKDNNSGNKEEIDLHKSIESIPSESDIGEDDTAHPIEDDEEEEAAEESAYEEELIEDTDGEDRDSENAVVLSSDDDDDEDGRNAEERTGDTSHTDEEFEEDYDDNDLMDSVILSTSKTSKSEDSGNKKRKRSERASTEELESELKTDKCLDWRADLKKRLKSGSNVFNDSKNSHSTVTSQHSDDDDEDYVLDIDVDMGGGQTYNDGYPDESSEPSTEIKSKSDVNAFIELDSSPEKTPTKPLNRDPPTPFSNEDRIKEAVDEKEEESNVKEDSQKDDMETNVEAVDDTIVPTNEKPDVPIINSLEKPKSPKESSTSLGSLEKSDLKDNNKLNEDLEVPNTVDTKEHEKSNNDGNITMKNDDTNIVCPPKTDLKDTIERDNESKSTRNKRRRSSSCSVQEHENDESFSTNKVRNEEDGHPAKKLKAELDTIFPKHNQILNDYISKTTNETVDNIQCHINQLLVEIQTLSDMIKTNENEWNNMIYLKKMKEEICIRLTRKKQTIQLESKKIGDISALFNDITSDETIIPKTDDIDKQRGPQLSSTPLHNKNNSSCTQNLSEQVSKILDGFESNSKSFSQSAANIIIQNRANMKSSELAKEKLNMQKVHRNILPKPASLGSMDALNLATSLLNGPSNQQQQSILNSYLSSSGFQQLGEMLNGNALGNYHNGNHQPMVGRQGAFKDVKSIIADYRQQHPESVPRRGRRVKQSSQNVNLQYDMKNDTNSRPSSNDSSSHSMSNAQNSQITDFLVQFNKMTGQSEKNNQGKLSVTSQIGCSGSSNGTYPEVTLHPVAGTTNDQAGSLLHGILTKNSRSKDSAAKITSAFSNNFSPTLAKLLTAPERMGSSGNNSMEYQNITKVVGNNSEITITPVLNSSGAQQSLLQQHLQPHHLKELMSKASNNERIKTEHYMNIDDEADDSVDRLVIDEGADGVIQHEDSQSIQNRITSHAIDENDVPFCQGCKKNEAQFVCAGCGNQWYCSRDCQVTSWDDHSEVCTATIQIRKKYNLLKNRDVIFKKTKSIQSIYDNDRNKYYIIRRK